MKSRLNKEINNMTKNSSIVVFSEFDLFPKGSKVEFKAVEDIQQKDKKSLTYYVGESKIKNRFTDIWMDFLMDVDNYLMTRRPEYIYILKRNKDSYTVIFKENVSNWIEAYWIEEDPKNERDWSYIDEDTAELYDIVTDKFLESMGNKYSKKLNNY